MVDKKIAKYIDKGFLYEELPCGFLSFRNDGTILSINKTMVTWMGTNVNDTSNYNFKTLLTKASMLYYNLVIEPILNLKTTVNEINLKFNSSDGIFDALLNAVAYKDDDGQVILVNATVQKIKDRKKYEVELLHEKRYAEEEREHADEEKRKFEFLFNSVPNQIWTADAEGNILRINNKLKDYFGNIDLTKENDAAGVFTEDRPKTLKEWKRCLSTGKRFERESRLLGAKMVPEWFLITAEPYLNTAGEIEMWFGSNTNINKQKLLQIANHQELSENLSSAYKNLNEKSDLLIKVAINQSHMVRRPLANILGIATLINQASDPKELEDLLTFLLKSVSELDEMIREVSRTTGL
jgi:PAS domain-containing protein